MVYKSEKCCRFVLYSNIKNSPVNKMENQREVAHRVTCGMVAVFSTWSRRMCEKFPPQMFKLISHNLSDYGLEKSWQFLKFSKICLTAYIALQYMLPEVHN